MPISPFLKSLRKKIGHDLIVLPSVSICHIDEQNRVLLMKFGDTDQWGLPGGAVEPNEQPTTAAVREMWEETGLHVKLTEVRAVYGGSGSLRRVSQWRPRLIRDVRLRF